MIPCRKATAKINTTQIVQVRQVATLQVACITSWLMEVKHEICTGHCFKNAMDVISYTVMIVVYGWHQYDLYKDIVICSIDYATASNGHDTELLKMLVYKG